MSGIPTEQLQFRFNALSDFEERIPYSPVCDKNKRWDGYILPRNMTVITPQRQLIKNALCSKWEVSAGHAPYTLTELAEPRPLGALWSGGMRRKWAGSLPAS